MPSEFTVTMEMNYIVPDFMDASVPLLQCGEAIKNDIQQNIRMQRSFDGSQFPSLSKKTISRKGFSMALYDKGVMFRAIHAYKTGHDKNVIMVGIIPRGKPPRDEVAIKLQEEGIESQQGLKRWKFFGISQKREQWITNRMHRWVNERIQKAVRKYFNLKF